jgi:acetyltransferase-like isoleucine patch superfamily enzyme
MVTANACSFQPCGAYRWDEIAIQPDAFFFMTQSTFDGAIRGIHMTNQSGLFLEDNTFDNNYNSVFIENYSSSPMLIVRGNTFICEEIGHAGLVQGPLSTVPFANPQYNYVTGIMVLNSQNVTLGQAAQSINTFTTTSPTNPAVNSELSYINLFNSQAVSIENNHFGAAYAAIWATQSDFTVGGSLPQKNIFWPAAFSPGALPYHSTAIYGKYSSATITYNEFKDLETAIVFERSGLILEGYQATTIAQNPIIEADYPIQFSSPISTGSRVLINNNPNISARVKAITFTDYIESDPPQVYINTNSINVNTPQSGLARIGIELKNCDAIFVGENTLTINGLYWPTGASNVIGIHVNGSLGPVGSKLSGNTIASFDMGLVMENDQGTTQFSCTQFNTCYTSVLYKNINATKVQDVNDFNSVGGSTASANVTFVNNVHTYPVEVQNCTVANKAKWYYNGAGNNPLPLGIGTFTNIFNYPIHTSLLLNNCNSLPSAKTNSELSAEDLKVLVFPNPSLDGFFTISVNDPLAIMNVFLFDYSGRLIDSKFSLSNNAEIVYVGLSGLFIIGIEVNGELSYEKVVICR